MLRAELREARAGIIGDYPSRRRELLEKDRTWFMRRAGEWRRPRRIPELDAGGTRVLFADGRVFEHQGVKLRFTGPLFHWVELMGLRCTC
ncbi:hypothetical protein CF15_00450 [Pyrodictium occultum]|uniref:Uncharacterized protein n=1 Tax=Pyrodictium occultum TaxID=2309 RepID=A0A0V8RTG8_PYROC|nr:hypothetical protein [Pyrodictium occultum]KSW11371.1 hypothetical protein CF15_00450 [Pyrodictium occultum]